MTVDFSGKDVRSIEETLEKQRPSGWRRLDAATLGRYSMILPRAGWELTVPDGQFGCPGVDRIHLLIDRAFPESEPRVVVPHLKVGDWPHVEPSGVLCLARTTWEAPPADRAIASLVDASNVLNFDEERRRHEFSREFMAYWTQLVSVGPSVPFFMTLMTPTAPSREVFFAKTSKHNRVILSDDSDVLQRWLRHSGEGTQRVDIRKTRLIWLTKPWMPTEFPQRVRDVLAAAEDRGLLRYLSAGESLPVLFGATTVSGPVFVGVDLPAVPRKQFRKGGFRDVNQIPGTTLAMLSANYSVLRCRVGRADPAWVHGRDHNEQQAVLALKLVGVIGCGSLGGAVARLLAQMGVGSFILVDADPLSAANTSRHVLGSDFVRENKATAICQLLLRDFPHLEDVESFPSRFQTLTDVQLDRLAHCDLIISAGIDWAGDVALDRWRRSMRRPPVHVCTWVEEFALVGHSVALFDADSLSSEFSAEGIPTFGLTQWPPEVHTLIVEAGCGNSFQPHGAVDLNSSVTLAAKLALDVLTEQVKGACRRSWLGDLNQLRRLGGKPSAEFDVSNTMKEFPWPHVEH